MPSALDIAKFINQPLHGQDVHIDGFSELSAIRSNTLVFAKKYNEQFADILNKSIDTLSIVTPEYTGKLTVSHLISDNPRLDFIKALSHFFAPGERKAFIHPRAIIEDGAQIGKDVYIGANCYISGESVIGDNCILHPNVVIDNKVIMGNNCEIKSGAVIGQEGFGFERDEAGIPTHFPHFGNVVIGNNVFIGSNSTVERAALGSTVIDDNVKIDDLVQIGHNSRICRNTMITVGAIICGGATIENDCYVAPNVSIKEKVKIGTKSFIGLGAVVIRNVEAGDTVIGNPAHPLIKKSKE